MNVNKLGLRLISSALATGLILAPMHGAWAGPADAGADAPSEGTEDAAAPPEGDAPPAEGEETPPAEGEVQPAEGEETPPAEGEATPPAEGELGPVEIEAPAEPEPEPEPETEGEDEVASEDEAPAPELEPVGPMKPPEPTWGPKDQYPMTGKGMLITGGVVTGLGAAFIATSVLVTRCDFDSSLSCKLGDQRDFLVPIAVTTTGLGLLLIGVGVGNHIKYKRWQNWSPETAVVPTMVPGGGGGLAWVGRF